MSTGTISQIIGAVIDAKFPTDSVPKIYDALKLADVPTTLEVQQQLGDGVVRTMPSPSCCCTSSVVGTSCSFRAS